MLYILLSFITGITIVVSMMLNGSLAKRQGMINSMLINYFMAAASSAALCAFMLKAIPAYAAMKSIPKLYFIGGIIGILTTYLFNLIVPMLSAVYVVMLRFIGQLLASALIDYFYLDVFSKGKIIGGILFLVGLIVNAKIDSRYLNQDTKT